MKRNRRTREKRKQPRLRAKLSVPYKSGEKIVNSSSNGIRHIFMSNIDMKRRIENAGSTPWRKRRRQPGGKPPNIRQRWRKRSRSGASRARAKNAGSAIDGNGRPRTSGIPRIFRNRCACMPGMIARRVIRKAISRRGHSEGSWNGKRGRPFDSPRQVESDDNAALRMHYAFIAYARRTSGLDPIVGAQRIGRANVRCADRRNDRSARAGRGGARPRQPLTARGTSATSSTCRSPCNPASAPHC